MQQEKLIEKFIEQTNQIINEAEKFIALDLHALIWKKDPSSWNILECLEHLNLYGEYYLPEIENEIKISNTTTDVEFKTGILGNYFAKSMLPKEKMKKIKTFKDKNPLNSKIGKNVITEFINQQISLLELLEQSKKISLNKVKIKISISKLITLKLGDTFQFYINHILRHLKQIENIQIALNKNY